MNNPISINILAYHGYDIATTLDEISSLSVRYVELVFIREYYTGFSENDLSVKNAAIMKRRLKERDLESIAFAAHMDLGRKNSVEMFRRRMNYAKEIGAQIINTNATDKSNINTFFQNMDKLIQHAEQLDIIIGLENPGAGQDNIIGTGKDGIDIIKRLGSKYVQLNYDFGNVFMYSKGTVQPENELEAIIPYTAHFHIKDLAPSQKGWEPIQIGKGSINYRNIFEYLQNNQIKYPMSIELPLKFWWDKKFDFITNSPLQPLPLKTIRDILGGSLRFINDHIST